MGHDHHFSSRLDRVTRDQVDLALALYRDEELVKYILAVAHAPSGHASTRRPERHLPVRQREEDEEVLCERQPAVKAFRSSRPSRSLFRRVGRSVTSACRT